MSSVLSLRVRVSRNRCMALALHVARDVWLVLVLCVGSLLLAPASVCAQAVEEPLAAAPAVDDSSAVELEEVAVGLRLIDVAQIDSREETFTVEAILYVEWRDSTQAASPGVWSEEAVDDRLKAMEWWPAPEFENGRGLRDRSGMILGIDEEGYIGYEERMNITLATELDFAQFPFDTQHLPIKIIIGGGPEEVIQLEISEFSAGLIRMPEWKFDEDSFPAAMERGIQPYGAGSSPLFSRAVFSIKIQRRWGYYFWRVMLPLFIITGVSWAVFWVRREELSHRLSITLTALLTIVAFNLIVADTLPRIAYLTFLDALITLTYFWLGLAIVQSVIVYRMAQAKQVAHAQRIDAVSRWLVPSSYFLICLIVFIGFLVGP